jgi:hypothetical protein
MTKATARMGPILATILITVLATGVPATAAGKKRHHFTLTNRVRVIESDQSFPTVGSSAAYAGVLELKLDGGKVVHGVTALRLTVTGGDLTSGVEYKLDERWYFPQGSIKSVGRGRAMLQPDSSVVQNGELKFTGGTGAFRGATGNDTYAGSQPNPDATATVNDNGTISY